MKIEISLISALSILEFTNPDSELEQQIQSAPPKAEKIYPNIEIIEFRQAFEMWTADIFNDGKGHQSSLKYIKKNWSTYAMRTINSEGHFATQQTHAVGLKLSRK